MAKERLLIFPFDLMSHYLRCIKVAERFSGYEVLFAASRKYNHFVAKAGFGTFEVEQFDAGDVMQKARMFDFSWLNFHDLERIFLSQVKTINELRPLLVLSDNSPTIKMSAEKTGVAHIALMNAYMSKYYDGLRHVASAHYSYKYMQRLPTYLASFITRQAEKIAFASVHKPFKKLRASYKLSRKKSYLDELEGDRNLVCDAEWLFSIGGAPSNYEVIGPLYFDDPAEETELLNFLDPQKKTVCVCLGSSGNWSSLSFLSSKKYSWINIIAAGDTQKILSGAHIFHRDFVNLERVLSHCSLLVCHGGNGTIYQGLKYEVPMLLITDHFEQEWNARRLQELGRGRIINRAPELIIDQELACVNVGGPKILASLHTE